MRILRFLFFALACLFLDGCTKMNVEDRALDAYWFSQRRSEILYIDREHSAFIRQGVSWNRKESAPPVVVYRNGKEISFPYTLEGDRFVFEEGTWLDMVHFEEAWFDPVGNLIVQCVQLLPNGDKYNKDPRPEGTWEVIYTRQDLSFLGE